MSRSDSTEHEYLETAITLLRLFTKDRTLDPNCTHNDGKPCHTCKAIRFLGYYDGTIADLYAEDASNR